tara:strand:+ start:398 stop:1309 length:912 start_codon:yes stop_codon:yes gene_type:complete
MTLDSNDKDHKDTLKDGKAVIVTGALPSVVVKSGGNPRLIISSPHSGRRYPDHFLTSTCRTLAELRQVEDAFMDILLTHFGLDAMQVYADFPRSFVDANRHQDELEKHIFDHLSDSIKIKTSRYTKAGLGVIPSHLSRKKPIYDHKLTEDELNMRLKSCYMPYHHALMSMIETGKASGEVILLDIHSMPSSLGISEADIIIGTCHGKSAPTWLSKWIKDYFTKQGLRTQMNTPFSGGFITSHYGSPKDDVFALQIEINRMLYMNEQHLTLSPAWHEFAKILTNLINQISLVILNKTPITPPAD